MIVFDATPLIYLAKIGLLEKLKSFPEKKVISEKVYKEVVEEGIKKGEGDAFVVEDLVKNGIFLVREPSDVNFVKYILKSPRIHEGDAQTLSLAKENNGRAIIDEEESRIIAKIENIKIGGTVFLLFRMLRTGLISKNELKQKLDQMISCGWRCSLELYAAILDELEKI